MNRTERQKLGIKRWIDAGGKATLVYGTGVGKTNTALMLVQLMYNRNPYLIVLIGVPTDVLKEQWLREVHERHLQSICKIETFDTIINNKYKVDLLILDATASPRRITIFDCVNYKYVLGLTATWERLDGAEARLEVFCPPCDHISLKEALQNEWVSTYKNYKVLLKVDMAKYWEYNSKFQQLFAYFNNNFKLIMYLIQNPKKVKIWCNKTQKLEGPTRGYLKQFMRYLKLRKSFVMSHPKKYEVATRIINSRQDKKIILFTATVKDAEQYSKIGLICHSKRKTKENKEIIKQFNSQTTGLIVSPQALRTGVDIKGLSVGISCSCNSSELLGTQALGRVVRFEEDKVAEFFTLVIADSIEELWYNNAYRNQSYITITEDQLDLILKGEVISNRPKKGLVDINNRY